MKTASFISVLLSSFFFYSMAHKALGQCTQIAIPLETKTLNSTLIIEGSVISQTSLWNADHTSIITSSSISVLSILKNNGVNLLTTINIITPGGLLNDTMETTFPSVDLKPGDNGIFFCIPSTEQLLSFELYGLNQGFIKHNLLNNQGSTAFYNYNDVTQEVYPVIEKITKQKLRVINMFQNRTLPQNSGSEGIIINSFSPATGTAGANQILTINGSGFGDSQGNGYVAFKNADDGGKSYTLPAANQYVKWSDNEIQVEIPFKAGTGQIQIGNNGSATAISHDELKVKYSLINVLSKGNAFETLLVGQNESGGYTIQPSNDFNAMPAAMDVFLLAMKSWQCSSYANLSTGTATDKNTSASDGINILRFANSGELPAGVLALTINRWAGCHGGTDWFCFEMDVSFDNSIAWSYDPNDPGNKYDFQTALLHELGHVIQLNHVLSYNAVMNYSVAPGEIKRNLSSDEVEGASSIIDKSNQHTPCNRNAFKKLSKTPCSTSINNLEEEHDSISIYPNPSSNGTFYIHQETKTNAVVKVFNSLGQSVFETTMGNELTKSIKLNGVSSGVYLVLIINSGNTYKQQIYMNSGL